MLGFYTLHLDGRNLGNMLTDTIRQDLKVNQNLINMGTQLLSAGIVHLTSSCKEFVAFKSVKNCTSRHKDCYLVRLLHVDLL